MQKEALLAESVVILWLLGLVLWQRYQRTLKKWWKTWWAKPKRAWTLQPRPPDDCPDCRRERGGSGAGPNACAAALGRSEESTRPVVATFGLRAVFRLITP
jgi:hypothetical protein